jgi:uncharacterized repeat protein (TIGR03833 family)
MDGKTRKNIHSGSRVLVVKKEDQKTSRLTEGVVKDILTVMGQKSPSSKEGDEWLVLAHC